MVGGRVARGTERTPPDEPVLAPVASATTAATISPSATRRPSPLANRELWNPAPATRYLLVPVVVGGPSCRGRDASQATSVAQLTPVCPRVGLPQVSVFSPCSLRGLSAAGG